jgi:adenylate cyclase
VVDSPPEHDGGGPDEVAAAVAARLARYEETGLWDPTAADAADRLAMLEFLAAKGATVERMVAAESETNLVSLGLDLVLESGSLSAEELAEGVGATVGELVELYRLLGVDVGDISARWFEPEEVEFIGMLQAALCTFDNDTAEEILRVLSASMGSLAAASISAFVGSVEGDLEAAGHQLRRAEVTQGVGELGLELAAGLRPLFRHHLRDAVIRQRRSMELSDDRRLSYLAVGFVDLVGYTSTTSTMAADELVAFTGRVRGRTYDVVTALGGRVVKHIGDEIMFSALEAEVACRIGLVLIEDFGEQGTLPRGGVAHGPVVARHGDLYGPVVNLAARLADIAVPGELLAPATIRVGIADVPALRAVPAGRRALKGFAEPVEVVAVEPAARGRAATGSEGPGT